MSFKKPFRAIPVKLGPYHQAEERQRQRAITTKVIGLVVAGELLVGVSAAASLNGGFARVGLFAREVVIANGWTRRNTPTPGAYYQGCNDAHAAGVTPLYWSDHGYRTEMDGDGDGVACERT